MTHNITEIFERLKKHNPHPKIELNFVNFYTLLVAVVLSARATDKGVNKATAALFEKVQTPEQMVALGVEGLEPYIQTIGLFRNKAKNILALSEILLRDYHGQVPQDRDELMKLPGVGRKSANVILNSALGMPYIGVDTHVFRVSHRLGFSQGKTPEKVEEDLNRLVPEEYKVFAGHWLVLHGRYICKAQKPLCQECFLADICPYAQHILNQHEIL